MIKNIRYAVSYPNGRGRVQFDWRGHAIAIREPADGTLLVGTDPALAAAWIYEQYGWLLDALPAQLTGAIVDLDAP